LGRNHELMRIIFLDIDGVLATPKQYGTQRNKLYSRDPWAKELRVPYMWDERCVLAFNRFIRLHDVEIVLSSDWRRHWSLAEIDKIFKINGVAKSPIGYTGKAMKEKMSEDLESLRTREIQDWLKENPADTWCAVDDMNLSGLGERFVQTDERMGFGAKGFIEKAEYAMFPGLLRAEQGICA
jgi:hypothetical protein